MKLKSTPLKIKKVSVKRKKNPIAKLLRTPLYKPRVKPSSKVYTRKKIKEIL